MILGMQPRLLGVLLNKRAILGLAVLGLDAGQVRAQHVGGRVQARKVHGPQARPRRHVQDVVRRARRKGHPGQHVSQQRGQAGVLKVQTVLFDLCMLRGELIAYIAPLHLYHLAGNGRFKWQTYGIIGQKVLSFAISLIRAAV